MFLFGPLKLLFHLLKQKHTCLPSFVTVHELINVIARTSDLYQYRTGSPQPFFYLLAPVLVNPFKR